MHEVRIGVLGPVSASVDGRPVALGGIRQRAVLAVLVAARGRLVPQDVLINDAWDGQSDPTTATLHSYIAGLRKVLEPGRATGGSARVLVREGLGYALRLKPDQVDAERFTELAAQGERLVRSGDPEAAAAVLGEALGLWRGPAYHEFAEYAFAVPEAARLHGLRLSAQEDLFTAELARGRHTAVIGDLEKHTAEQPLSERGWELLALALYRSGRQGDALSALRTARRVLAEELGVDPGPSLRRLEVALLEQDSSAAPPVTGPVQPVDLEPASPARRGRRLPLALTGLVGRDEERARIGALLRENRLVTLTGAGGIGKTRLALEVAHARDDEDGPWLVELADLETPDPELLVADIADVLGFRDATTAERLAQVLGARSTLLLLDNCEHVLSAAASTVAHLLSHCPGLRILATSREPLSVAGEVVYEVGPLPPGAARELFFARAAAAVPGWVPDTHEIATGEAICQELDGLPLAIELAAAQCRMLAVDQIAQALDDPFAVLVGGPETGPARHRALQTTVEWSHRLLNQPERELFYRLSVFAGGFDLDAATAVGGRPVLSDLTALVRKSLLATVAGSRPRRYRMLQTLKDFARRKADPAVLTAAQASHRSWVLGRAEAAEQLLYGKHARAGMEQTTRDLPEIRAAFTSALLARDSEYALRLAGALHRYWYRWGHIAEGLGWLKAALDICPEGAPGPRARALMGMGALSYLLGDFATAAQASAEAARHAREADDLRSEAGALAYRALFEGLLGKPGSEKIAEGAVVLARASQEPWLESETLMVLGMLLRMTGPSDRAREILTRSRELARACGHRFVQASSAWLLMKSDIDEGRPAEALAAGVTALRVIEEEGDVTGWLAIAHATAAALTLTGHREAGAMLLGVVEEQGSRIGYSPVLMDPVDGPGHARLVRDALSTEDFVRCHEAGRKMSPADMNEYMYRSVTSLGAGADREAGAEADVRPRP
ncbi:BTAD domain-containing putative transcriptional regulator [Streptomyces sp. H51]|uniref:BTAD domain-containing putative transcriptional regulator n=1 Tax=Streptomyces sp. H51 TaxID=3111770 RepID=UPI002D77D919|nr:BTAD domain-containing putative transcriptional regulator [Streptomyces sp. H51]